MAVRNLSTALPPGEASRDREAMTIPNYTKWVSAVPDSGLGISGIALEQE